jgi:integrase/recombinase XerD
MQTKAKQTAEFFIKLQEAINKPSPERTEEEKRLIEILENEEIKKLLSIVDNTRDKLIIILGLKGGLRESETANVMLKDFKFYKHKVSLTVTEGKGRKVRTVTMGLDVDKIVKDFVKSTGRDFNNRADRGTYLLQSRKKVNDGKLSGQHINRIIQRYVKKAGLLKHVSSHTLRHTCGTNMALNKAPMQIIQNFLGHSSPNTTAKYIHP